MKRNKRKTTEIKISKQNTTQTQIQTNMTYINDTTLYCCALVAVGYMLFGPIGVVFALGAVVLEFSKREDAKLYTKRFLAEAEAAERRAIRRQRDQAQADSVEREAVRRRRVQAKADAVEREAFRRQRIQAQANAAEREARRRQRIQDEANAQEARISLYIISLTNMGYYSAAECEALRRQRIQAQANAAEREAVRRQRVQAQADATEREARYEYSFNFR